MAVTTNRTITDSTLPTTIHAIFHRLVIGVLPRSKETYSYLPAMSTTKLTEQTVNRSSSWRESHNAIHVQSCRSDRVNPHYEGPQRSVFNCFAWLRTPKGTENDSIGQAHWLISGS